MATILPLLILGGGILKSIGQRQEAESRAQALEFNATVAEQEGIISVKKRQLEKGQEEKSLKTFISFQRATFAKAGVTLSGSPIQVIEESAAAGELDIIIGDINASIEQSRLQSESEIRRAEAKSRRATGKTRAGLTLLTSGLQAGLAGGLFAKAPTKTVSRPIVRV